ncbi:MAG: HlyD family efflux transporter periplasmic adaptor subunit, partial [Nannocystaceae bacterium]|nr:HlyD family efflux transporter periplasmic adaptor subunit [Nannocystaceae bacterium]
MSADFLRRRVLPWTVWLATMSTAAYLWHGTVGQSGVHGYVEGITYGVTSPQDGRVHQIMVVPGQRVQAGDVVAQLSDTTLRAELDTLVAKRKRVVARFGAAAAENSLRLGETSRGIEETVDTAEIALKQARADRAVQSTEFKALDAQLLAVKELVDEHMADRRELADLTVKHAALRKGIQVADGLIGQLEGKVKLARARRTGESTDTTALLTDPLRVELEVIDAKEKLLSLQIAALSLRAPGDGEVTTVHLRTGEFAGAGSPVVTIRGSDSTTDDGRSIVFACASEAQAARLGVGEEVVLQATEGGDILSGFVQRLAPAVTELPPRCWNDPRMPIVGRGVFVATREPRRLLPGQSFQLRFTGIASEQAEAPITPPPSPTQ